jgi:arylformamidase
VGCAIEVLRRIAVTLIDISVAYGADTPPWPGDTPYSCGWAWDMSQGASVNVGRVQTSWHVGTHADAPLHVSPSGAPSETLPLTHFTGAARVIDVSAHDADAVLSVDDLAAHVGNALAAPRLLLHTGRCVANGHFPDAWPTLSPAAAAWLVSRGLQLLGTDAPSVDARSATTLQVHAALFGGGAYVLENLHLSHAMPGMYQLTAYPVLVHGADAAPVRAVLDPIAPA